MTAPVILIEATPRRASDGAVVPLRLAGGGGERPYHYGGEHWRAGIMALPRVVGSLDFDNEQLGGGGIAQAMELRWGPGSDAALAELAALFWADAAITVRIGPEGPDLPPVVASGLALDAAVESGALRIVLADEAADLKRPLLTNRFAGTGGLEGPMEWKDVLKARAWGRCFNVPGRLIDKATNIWCFGDPMRPWQAFDQVRDRGAAADADRLSSVAWQGTAATTFAALQAAEAAQGGGVLAPSIACVKWWTAPAGDLHADIRGEIEGGYVETAPEIVARIVAARSAIGFAAGAIEAARNARPMPFGFRVDSEAMTAAEAVSEILADVSTSWMMVGGVIAFRHWDWSAPAVLAESADVQRRQVYKPVATRRLGYRRNWSPMARGDIAAIVFARDVIYDDGGDAESLKPAEGGATKGGIIGENISLPDGAVVPREDLITGEGIANDIAHIGGRPVPEFLAGIDAAVADIDLIRDNGLPVVDEALGELRQDVAAARSEADQIRDNLTAEVLRAQGEEGAIRTIATAAQASATGANARIDDEITIRANADVALANRASALEASVNTGPNNLASLRATITEESTVRAGADATIANRATALESVVGSPTDGNVALKARIGSEETTRAAADTSLANRATALEASVNTGPDNLGALRAGITDEATVRATADSALANRAAALEATVDTGPNNSGALRAAIVDEATVRSNADSALANRASILESVVNSGTDGNAVLKARIEAEETTRASNDSAIAQSVQTVSAQIGGLQASVNSVAQAVDGVRARYGVSLDVNGYVTGFVQNNDGVSGTFTVLTDRFAIVQPGLNPYVPFEVINGQVRIKQAAIGTLTVDRLTSGTLGADINVGAGRITWANGAHMKVAGVGFGTQNQFLEWFGPQMPVSQCSEANAIQYLKTNGDAYFGGALSAGVLKNGASATGLSLTEQVVVGPFGSNGGARVVTLGYTYFESYTVTSGGGWSGQPSAQLVLERQGGGGAWTQLATLNANGSTTFSPGFSEFEPGSATQTISGSVTFTDTSGGLSATYRGRMLSRSSATLNASTQGAATRTQSVSVLSTEQ
jgi:hypothetical protein